MLKSVLIDFRAPLLYSKYCCRD